jgi:hypothetical protein
VLFFIVMRYTRGPGPVYERAAERGRMLPDGVKHLGSWIVDDERLDTCYEVAEAPDRSLIDEWIGNWGDLATFEVMPVVTSEVAAERAGIEWSP